MDYRLSNRPYCIHNRVKYYCKLCKGGAFCKHNIHKRYCASCNGNALCQHLKNKYRCKTCVGLVVLLAAIDKLNRRKN